MTFWEPDNLRAVTLGQWLRRPAASSAYGEPFGVSTDSRTIERGQVFVAIAGDRFDGHHYVADAFAAGAPIAIVERGIELPDTLKPDVGLLRVESTMTALARLATAYRRTLSATVIGVTGSVGKTTTKQMIHAVLSRQLVGTVARKSFNNHIGVPLTLLNAAPRDRFVVVEAGTNAPGEIDALARMIQPDVAVITAIGLAHVEKLGGLEAIAAEKAGLLRHMTDGGLAIVNGDAPWLEPHLKLVPRRITFGRGDRCDLRLTDVQPTGEMVRFQVNGRRWFSVPGIGSHNAMNALAAIGVARHMKLDDEAIVAGLAGYEPPPMRLDLRRIGAVALINDAYNANPASMEAAIETLVSAAPGGGRKVAILGEMAELGDRAPELHRELGKRLAASEVDVAILIGRSTLYVAEALHRSWPAERVHPIAAWTEGTAAEVAALLESGDTVLLKASRSAALERLVPAIEQRFADPTALSQRPT